MTTYVDPSLLELDQKEAHDRLFEFLDNRANSPEKEQFSNIILRAPGGFGKSYVLRALFGTLCKNGMRLPAACTLSGIATLQLSGAGVTASTIHSLLYYPELDSKGNLVGWIKRNFSEIQSATRGGIVVDEASMISADIAEDLMSIGAPIIWVGDHHQLPPVVVGDSESFCVFDDVMGDVLTLTKNRRVVEGRDNLFLINATLRESPNIPRKAGKGVSFVRKSDVFRTDFHEQNDFDLIVCGMNKTRKKINNAVRAARGVIDSDTAVPGEKVICLKNTIIENVQIFNGETFLVEKKIPRNDYDVFFLKSIDFPDKMVGVQIAHESWEREAFNKNLPSCVPFGFAYAMTCHKSQGKTARNVLFYDENVSFFLDQRKFRYTGCSRAAAHLTIAI